jgi:hypothetical protein
MDADDFRRIALSLDGSEESSHMGKPDFRVGGRIFATLASAKACGLLPGAPSPHKSELDAEQAQGVCSSET